MRINTLRMRFWIGLLGMLLPWIVVLLIGYFPQSISATWYTNACTPFMIILGWASGMLICYKGYDRKDDIVFSVAGIAGFGICLFPCSIATVTGPVGPFLVDSKVSNVIHFACAIIFFGLLSFASLFLFTKSTGEMTKKKNARNIIYRVCGIGMLASFLLLLLPIKIKVWLMETVLLSFFGISFLTKADIFPFLFCETAYTDEGVETWT